jgi:hypothetical protein
MRVTCPCGMLLKDWRSNDPYLAEFRPDQHSDAYCGAIEEAIRRHPGDPEITASWIIYDTLKLFHQAWQCPVCGRLLVPGPDGKYHSFVLESPETPRDLFAGWASDMPDSPD